MSLVPMPHSASRSVFAAINQSIGATLEFMQPCSVLRIALGTSGKGLAPSRFVCPLPSFFSHSDSTKDPLCFSHLPAD